MADIRADLVAILNGLTKQDDAMSIASKIGAVIIRIDEGEYEVRDGSR